MLNICLGLREHRITISGHEIELFDRISTKLRIAYSRRYRNWLNGKRFLPEGEPMHLETSVDGSTTLCIQLEDVDCFAEVLKVLVTGFEIEVQIGRAHV